MSKQANITYVKSQQIVQNKAMTLLLVIILSFIAYGSLYPFNFYRTYDAIHSLNDFFNWNIFSSTRGDIADNLILFMPLGFIGLLMLPTRWHLVSRLSILLSFAFVYATALQVAQFYLPTRVPSMPDAIWNTIGTLLGAAFTFSPILRNLFTPRHFDMQRSIPFTLISCWLLYRLLPLVPSLDLQMIKDAIKHLLYAPSMEAYFVFHSLLAWLICFSLAQAWPIARRWGYLLCAVIAIFCMEILIVNNTLSRHNLFGATIALIIWPYLRKQAHQRSLLLLALTTLFIWAHLRRPDWLPFTLRDNYSMSWHIAALTEKVFFYGSFIWLMFEGLHSRLKQQLQ